MSAYAQTSRNVYKSFEIAIRYTAVESAHQGNDVQDSKVAEGRHKGHSAGQNAPPILGPTPCMQQLFCYKHRCLFALCTWKRKVYAGRGVSQEALDRPIASQSYFARAPCQPEPPGLLQIGGSHR